MDLTFLGTGAGDFPACEDESSDAAYVLRARQLGGRNLRHSSSSLLAPDILIDFYSAQQLERLHVDVAGIRHLLLTHGHWDHFQPLAILELASRLPNGLDIYGNELIGRSLEFAATNEWDATQGRFRAIQRDGSYRFHLLAHQQTAAIGDVEVTPVQGHHKIDKQHMIVDELVYNYVIEQSGRTLFYGLDSSSTLPGTLQFLSRYRVDLAVVDATFGELEIDPLGTGHHNFDMLEVTIAEFREAGIFTDATRIIGSHISVAHVAPHDDIAADTLERRGFELAYDGLEVSF